MEIIKQQVVNYTFLFDALVMLNTHKKLKSLIQVGSVIASKSFRIEWSLFGIGSRWVVGTKLHSYRSIGNNQVYKVFKDIIHRQGRTRFARKVRLRRQIQGLRLKATKLGHRGAHNTSTSKSLRKFR